MKMALSNGLKPRCYRINKNTIPKVAEKLQHQSQKVIKNGSTEDLDFLIHSCNIQRFTTKESLHYLKTKGHEISERKFFKRKSMIRQNVSERTTLALENLMPQHFRRIDVLNLITKHLWNDYHTATDGNLKLKILNSIRENENMVFSLEGDTMSVVSRQMESFDTLPIENKLNYESYLEKKKANRIKYLKEMIDSPATRMEIDFDGTNKKRIEELEELESAMK